MSDLLESGHLPRDWRVPIILSHPWLFPVSWKIAVLVRNGILLFECTFFHGSRLPFEASRTDGRAE